jgi:hypothetical protein
MRSSWIIRDFYLNPIKVNWIFYERRIPRFILLLYIFHEKKRNFKLPIEWDFISKTHSEEIVIGYVLHNDIYLVVYFIEKDNAW